MTTHAGQPRRPRPAGAAGVDRTAGRAARRIFRPRRTWPAMVASILMTLAGVTVAFEVISTMAESPGLLDQDRIAAWLTGTHWDDLVTVAAGGAAALLGLACLLAGLNPGHTSLMPLHSDDPELVVGVTRGGLRRAVATAAGDVEMVTSVGRVQIHRHRVRVGVETALRDFEGLGERVAAAVARRLDDLGLSPRRRVAVRVRRERR